MKMMTQLNRNAYSEVFEALKHTQKKDLMKVPVELVETIKENRNEEYMPVIDLENIHQSMSKKARELYIWLYLTYMVEDQKQKENIQKLLYNNELKLNSNSDVQDIFEQKEENHPISNQTMMVENKTNIFQKLLDKIKNIFKRK